MERIKDLHLYSSDEKVLRLVLKRKWFDLIASGEKTEEYREITPFWWKRLVTCGNTFDSNEPADWQMILETKFDFIEFYDGYRPGRREMLLKWQGMKIGEPRGDWSDNAQGKHFVISLGEIFARCNF